jgi:hypothetical protein
MQLIIETADWDALGGHWVEAGFDQFSITQAPSAISEESKLEKGKLIDVVDVLGRSVKNTTNSPVFYRYENGVVEKKLIIE